jgi:hypothetical protein
MYIFLILLRSIRKADQKCNRVEVVSDFSTGNDPAVVCSLQVSTFSQNQTDFIDVFLILLRSIRKADVCSFETSVMTKAQK